MTLGERLRSVRESRSLNLTEAAAKLGVARTAYRLWELGAAAPAPEHWKDVALWCQVPLPTILRELGHIDEDEERALLALEVAARS